MGLQHLYIPISPHLLEDMQVSSSFRLCCVVKLYAKFTEAMTRFYLADVVVHRLLAASLGIAKLPPIFQDRVQLTSISDSMPSTNVHYITILLHYKPAVQHKPHSPSN